MAESLPLAGAFCARHADLAAEALDEMEPGAVAGLLVSLPVDAGLRAASRMAPDRLGAALSLLDTAGAVNWLKRLPPQASAAALRSLPTPARQGLLAELPRAHRLRIELLLGRPRLTVGAWMDTRVVPVHPEGTASAAIRRLARQSAAVPTVMVTDAAGRLIGRVDLSSLLAARPEARIATLVDRDASALPANATLEAALDAPAWADHDVLPVLGPGGRLLGVIRYAALRRAYAETQAERAATPEPDAFIGLANMWYLGMAAVMDLSLGHRKVSPRSDGGGRGA